MSKIGSKVVFDGIPVDPYGKTPGANFAVATYYIPVAFHEAGVSSIQIQGDGTAAATATLQHTDFEFNLDGTAIDPRVAGVASTWDTDAAVGTLTVLASATETGQDRATFSNQPRKYSRIVLVVTVGGRIRGACSGITS